MDSKVCKICGEEKPLSEFYSYNKQKKTGEQYVWYEPSCKLCSCKRSAKWKEDNPERYKILAKRRDDRHKEDFRKRSKMYRLNGKQKEWAQNNRDKIHEYNKRRSQHKKHDITTKEWDDCKEYFNNSCAYCGISEEKSKIKTNNSLHKEHVDHDGNNDLSNCIPACKSCNCQKHTFGLDEWYNQDNDKFSIERYNKILNWINEDYKKYKTNKTA